MSGIISDIKSGLKTGLSDIESGLGLTNGAGGVGNIFKEVLADAEGVEQSLLGPSYPYYKNIKTPSELGMNSNGSIQQMATDISGLINYVEVLVSGGGSASVPGRPLGNKFFLQTGAKCASIDTCSNPKDPSTCQKVDRFIYVDNVPNGDIPFISSGLGVNFSELKGLIPGAMGNLNVLNPYAIMRAFLAGSTPLCQTLTMQTIDISNNVSSATQYVTLADISNINACSFQSGTNPVSNATCKETFQNNELKFPDDPLAQVYFASLGILGIFILYRLMEKSR
jgi:hypothetical protein